MKRHFPVLSVLLAFAMLLASATARAQNPLPNSPPSLVPRNPSLQPATVQVGTKDPTRATDTTSTTVATSAGATAPAPPTVSGDYVLSPSDTLEMSVFNEPSLTTQTRISADGTVQFPLIGEIKLGGMPVRDAREMVRRRYNADYLVEPQVYLNVTAYAQRRYTVLGQVNKPGTFDFPGGQHLGLLEAIGEAGGFTRLANESTVQVKRAGAGGEQTFKVNTKKLVTREGKPFDLAPGDVITVGESWF